MDITSAPLPRAAELEPDRRGRTETPGGQLPLWRLYALRAVYLYLVVGLAVTRWPAFVGRDEPLPLMEGVVDSILVALSVLFLLGIRYPTQLLPLLIFEAAWKVTWLATVALPLWTADRMTPAFSEMAFRLYWVAPVLLVLPWRHLIDRYLRRPGDRWR